MINGSAIGSITSKAAEAGLRSFLTILALGAISILSLCIAYRLKGISFTSYDAFVTSITVTRIMLVLTYVFSYCFVFASSIMLNGVGIAYSGMACEAAVLLCIVNLCLLIGFAIVFGLMLGYRKAMVRGKGIAQTCYIGLDIPASVALISYDVLMNLYLTALFVQPLWKPSLSDTSTRLRRLAKRTSIGCFLALIVTTTNLVTLSVFHGEELGAICLSCCTTDTILNALILFWVTSPHISERSETVNAGPFMSTERPGEMTSAPGSSAQCGQNSGKRSNNSGSTAFELQSLDVNSCPSFAGAMEAAVEQDHVTLKETMGESSIGPEMRKSRSAKSIAATNGLINQIVDMDLQHLEDTHEPKS